MIPSVKYFSPVPLILISFQLMTFSPLYLNFDAENILLVCLALRTLIFVEDVRPKYVVCLSSGNTMLLQIVAPLFLIPCSNGPLYASILGVIFSRCRLPCNSVLFSICLISLPVSGTDFHLTISTNLLRKEIDLARLDFHEI